MSVEPICLFFFLDPFILLWIESFLLKNILMTAEFLYFKLMILLTYLRESKGISCLKDLGHFIRIKYQRESDF